MPRRRRQRGCRQARSSARTWASLPAWGHWELKVVADAATVFQASDVVLDFTLAAASTAHAKLAAETGRALVLGTTGLDRAQGDAVRAAAKHAPILWAANFSLGVNLLLSLVENAAQRLGEDYDIEVLEMHHRHKVDAPRAPPWRWGRRRRKAAPSNSRRAASACATVTPARGRPATSASRRCAAATSPASTA